MTRFLVIFSLFVSTLVLAQTPVVSQQELLDLQQQHILLLDVRSEQEYAEQHIPKAINIDYETLPNRINEISEYKDLPVIVYCRSGRRAAIAEKALQDAGFTDVRHLSGDMLEWNKQKRPTTSLLH
ncbi:rhodanese-like domain-containing protein [Thalassotalea agarivorans]|uniref:Rhodanese-related sulfurtransferase n=1 Tax=Thalassotalea agarivorans TaxID=349064 RepID=A0A1I0AWI4_THASX|nr:rhodanese-like domain-containing protein [Thalassotalea agarivorans]SES98737.1 Rhodanese-related sulfurtransferase [Thalassotalea agarivorans]